MTTSHTGRNGLIEESQQTTVQRELFNNSMSPNGQRGNLSAIFPKSPIHMTDAERQNAFANGQDRADYMSTGDPYEDFKAYSVKDVIGGFGFESSDVSMTYNHIANPEIDVKGIAEPERNSVIIDLFDDTNNNVLKGHANLNVGPGFATPAHQEATSTQVERNELVPGSEVDSSDNRLDNISQYFNGAGNRSQNP